MIAQCIVKAVLAALALTTLCTHIAQVTGLSFSGYTWMALSSVLLSVGLTFFFVVPAIWKSTTLHRDHAVLWTLLLAALLGAVLAEISYRTDADDYYYVPNAVYYVQNPDAPMGFGIHFVHSREEPFVSHSWGTSVAFEYQQAALARAFRLELLFIYYFITPAAVGFLIPLALFLVTHALSDNSRTAVIGTLAALGVLLLLGETHRTFGNFSFTRAQQGKTLVLAVGIPVFVALTIEFFRSPRWASWLALWVTATAMAGASASSIILLPPLAIVLFLANLVAGKSGEGAANRRGVLKTPVLYFATLSYLFAYAGLLTVAAGNTLGSESPANAGWPRDFAGHVGFFIDSKRPLTPVVVGVATVAALLLVSKRNRVFLTTWILALAFLFLNPIVAPVLIDKVTTPNTYWRLFYLLPFPLVVALATGEGYRRLGRIRRGRTYVLALVILLLTTLHFVPGTTSVFSHDVELGWPRYNLPPQLVESAREIGRIAPPGPMLAPYEICAVIAMVDGDHPQLRARIAGVRHWLALRGETEEAELRLHASKYCQSGRESHRAAFDTILEYPELCSVVVVTGEGAPGDRPELMHLFVEQGFVHRHHLGRYLVVWRADCG